MTSLFLLLLVAANWSEPALVEHDDQPVLSYRARFDGSHLIVEIKPEPGWHTYAMDNKQRQTAALKGRMSLGSEKPTSVVVGNGLAVTGEWRQSEPQDFSKPEIQFYSYGFGKTSLLAAPVKPESDKAEVTVKGQACSESVCRNVEVVLTVDLKPGSREDLSALTDLLR